jgi:peptidylprolyl isomerase
VGVVSARHLLGGGLGALIALAIAACGGASAPPGRLSSEPTIVPPSALPPSRLVVNDLIVGKGQTAAPGDQVTVKYVGVLYRNGKVFDSSWERGRTFTTDLSNGSVMSGWVTGIVGERVGGRRELIIPPSLAYGASGNPPKIPANSTLIFDIDLLAVSRKAGGD